MAAQKAQDAADEFEPGNFQVNVVFDDPDSHTWESHET